MTPAERIRAKALELGFDAAGITAVEPLEVAARFETWLALGRHGGMSWLASERNRARRADPARILAGVRSVVCVALVHEPARDPARDARLGRIARYATGEDYHRVMYERLGALQRFIEGEALPGAHALWYSDTGAILERAWAERAGLGWTGKHAGLLAQERGSYFLLGEVLVDRALEPDRRQATGGDHSSESGRPAAAPPNLAPEPGRPRAAPVDRGLGPAPTTVHEHCGTCTRCLDACPTRAIVAPYQVDARRCISYLTIEHRGPIPVGLRPLIGEWVFGCDVCQEVCPWNRFAPPAREARLHARSFEGWTLERFLSLDQDGFRALFAASPIRRAGRDGFLRNVCVVLGNRGEASAAPALAAALAAEPDALVRAHAAWALGEIGRKAVESTGPEARAVLERAAAGDGSEEVRVEARGALDRAGLV